MIRVLTAGILGGIMMFLWGYVSHVLLPLGHMGIQSLPSEETVLTAMRSAIQEPGLYFFPGMDMSKEPSPEEQRAWEEKYKAGPIGILVYRPQGEQPLALKQLLTELGSNILAALVAAFLLTLTQAPFAKRVVLVTLVGAFAWLSISVSQWNWYGFPTSFTTAEGIDQVVGAFLTGLVLAAIVKPSKPATATA